MPAGAISHQRISIGVVNWGLDYFHQITERFKINFEINPISKIAFTNIVNYAYVHSSVNVTEIFNYFFI